MLLVYAFLPQTWLLLPFAAIFVAICMLVCLFGGQARGYGLCLLLGAVLGLVLMWCTNSSIAAVQAEYAGQNVTLTAEVESTSSSYYEGVVNAVLHVKTVNGEAANFRCESIALYACEAGELVQGKFALTVPESDDEINSYADGIILQAECLGDFDCIGQSSSFRAWTSRVQKALSESVRYWLDENIGGVLAAMVIGDRNALPREMNNAYRAAGLSHVLVVSGMHVSILCGDIFKSRRRERGYAVRRLRALWSSLLALLLIGVTGFTPSVLRAAVAVWISAFGVWVYGQPDALTSLAAAGVLMSLGNGYAACDVGFELSFAAVLGTLVGAECARRGRVMFAANKAKQKRGVRLPAWRRVLRKGCGSLWDTIIVSACASAGTFPVLVLRGLSASLYALVSSVAVLWLVDPLMYLGIGAAIVGLVPVLRPLHYLLSACAGLITYILNAWAVMVADWPGAQIYFDTAYSALVCLVLITLCLLASHWHVRLRIAVPAVVFAFAAAFCAGNALERDVAHIELVGGSNTPAAVIVQEDTAVVLFRGGAAAQRAVENALARRSVQTVELLIDMRLAPKTACTIDAAQTINAAELKTNAAQTARAGEIEAEIYRTSSGCAVRLDVAGRSLAALSGTVELAKQVEVDWLLASPANPEALQWDNMLALSSNYHWMIGGETYSACGSLALRPNGGAKLLQ